MAEREVAQLAGGDSPTPGSPEGRRRHHRHLPASPGGARARTKPTQAGPRDAGAKVQPQPGKHQQRLPRPRASTHSISRPAKGTPKTKGGASTNTASSNQPRPRCKTGPSTPRPRVRPGTAPSKLPLRVQSPASSAASPRPAAVHRRSMLPRPMTPPGSSRPATAPAKATSRQRPHKASSATVSEPRRQSGPMMAVPARGRYSSLLTQPTTKPGPKRPSSSGATPTPRATTRTKRPTSRVGSASASPKARSPARDSSHRSPSRSPAQGPSTRSTGRSPTKRKAPAKPPASPTLPPRTTSKPSTPKPAGSGSASSQPRSPPRPKHRAQHPSPRKPRRAQEKGKPGTEHAPAPAAPAPAPADADATATAPATEEDEPLPPLPPPTTPPPPKPPLPEAAAGAHHPREAEEEEEEPLPPLPTTTAAPPKPSPWVPAEGDEEEDPLPPTPPGAQGRQNGVVVGVVEAEDEGGREEEEEEDPLPPLPTAGHHNGGQQGYASVLTLPSPERPVSTASASTAASATPPPRPPKSPKGLAPAGGGPVYDSPVAEDPSRHEWFVQTFRVRPYCAVCHTFLRGVTQQGLECEGCAMAIHRSCLDSVTAVCHRDQRPKQSTKRLKRSRRSRTHSPVKFTSVAGPAGHDEIYKVWDLDQPVGSGDSGIVLPGTDIYAPVAEDRVAAAAAEAPGPGGRFSRGSSLASSLTAEVSPVDLHGPMQDKPTWQSQQPEELLASLPRAEVTRQEAIFEFLFSEQKYLEDLNTLRTVFLFPLHVHYVSTKPKGGKLVMPEELIMGVRESAEALSKAGSAFLARLQARQAEAGGGAVATISDVVLGSLPELRAPFLAYGRAAVRVLGVLGGEDHSPELTKFLSVVEGDARAALGFHAYILTPIQRALRLPMLAKAVADVTPDGHADHADALAVVEALTGLARTLDRQTTEEEEASALQELEDALDLSRLPSPIPISDAGPLLKRGVVSLVRLLSGRVVWSKKVELFVFESSVWYAKIVRERKTRRVRYLVYLQAHRQLCDVATVEGNGDALFQVTVYDEEHTAILVFQSSPAAEREQWLRAFGTTEQGDVYGTHDCPLFVAVSPYGGVEEGVLSLREGDRIRVVRKEASGWMKGELERTGEVGWFPANAAREVVTLHTAKKIMRALDSSRA